MDIADLERIAEASRDRFRFEGLPQYLVEEEAEEFAAWRRGNRSLPNVDDDPWLSHIRNTTAAGAHWWRVRILDYPLSEYSEYELHGYQGNAAAGEEIYVADRSWSGELSDLCEDFWLFDNETVVKMVYDGAGHFVRPELASNLDRYLGLRAVAFRHAVSLTDFLADKEPRLIA